MELSKLNPDKAYIQVTHAEPYFDNYGKKSFFVFSIFISSTVFDNDYAEDENNGNTNITDDETQPSKRIVNAFNVPIGTQINITQMLDSSLWK